MGLDMDIRALWPHSAASIPANWNRDDAEDFEGRFLQGSSTAGSNGGVADHTHVADAHAPTGDAHTHTVPAVGAGIGSVVGHPLGPNIRSYPSPTHTHPSSVSASTTITYDTTVVTINTDVGKPPFMEAILIGPDDGDQEMPDDSVGFFTSTSIPTGFSLTDGTGGTVDLSEKFIVGAAAAGDGGGTGGSLTHIHVSPGHLHTPTGTHDHAAIDYTSAVGVVLADLARGNSSARMLHHKQDVIAGTPGSTSSDAVTVDSASSEPAHTLLHGVQNISGGALTPDGVILPFVGTTVPEGWTLCDGSNGTPDLTATQVKVTVSPTQLGQTGGSDDDHLHTTQPHPHTHSSHSHSFGLTNFASQDISGASSTAQVTSAGHAHITTPTGSTTPTLQNNTVVLNTSAGKPLFRTVKFIRKGTPTVILRGGTVRGATVR